MIAVLHGPLTALMLAVVAAVCFAVAAVLQHRVVDAVTQGTSTDRTLSWDGFKSLATRRGWLLGVGVAVAGVVLHASALVLAPLSVVQPIGVLAVPIAVILTARHSRQWLTVAVWIGVGMSVAGVLAFVAVTAGTEVTGPVQVGTALVGVACAAGMVAVLAAVGVARRGWVRCVACAMAGAVAFGVVSALVRTVSLQVGLGAAGVVSSGVVTAAVGAIVALLVGGWLVQQAYAAGAPAVVVACLTVVDPVVAIGLGMASLGEGASIPPTSWALLLAAAVVAGAGTVVLARHHPDATAGTAPPDPATPLPELVSSR